MDPIEFIEGKVSVLDRAYVDTDQMIPKQFLKRVERTGFGEFLFYDWIRDGEIELEPNTILVGGGNVGCGSPRRHARRPAVRAPPVVPRRRRSPPERGGGSGAHRPRRPDGRFGRYRRAQVRD